MVTLGFEPKHSDFSSFVRIKGGGGAGDSEGRNNSCLPK